MTSYPTPAGVDLSMRSEKETGVDAERVIRVRAMKFPSIFLFQSIQILQLFQLQHRKF